MWTEVAGWTDGQIVLGWDIVIEGRFDAPIPTPYALTLTYVLALFSLSKQGSKQASAPTFEIDVLVVVLSSSEAAPSATWHMQVKVTTKIKVRSQRRQGGRRT